MSLNNTFTQFLSNPNYGFSDISPSEQSRFLIIMGYLSFIAIILVFIVTRPSPEIHVTYETDPDYEPDNEDNDSCSDADESHSGSDNESRDEPYNESRSDSDNESRSDSDNEPCNESRSGSRSGSDNKSEDNESRSGSDNGSHSGSDNESCENDESAGMYVCEYPRPMSNYESYEDGHIITGDGSA